MKFLIALDSYKSCISSWEAGNAVASGLIAADSSFDVQIVPLADGGEGTVAAISAGNDRINLVDISLPDALGRMHNAQYANFQDEPKAFVELANICGIELLKSDELCVMRSSTYGLGLMLKHLIEKGISEIFIGIGGSCSCDGGLGMLQALGAKFFDRNGEILPEYAGGGMLKSVKRSDLSAVSYLLEKVKFTVCCDVNNPLLGDNGCAAVFAPQKGATPEMVNELEQGMDNYFNHFRQSGHCCSCNKPGDGAAGGVGFALRNILHAELIPGGELLLQLSGFDDKAADADFLITGEGRSDSQTLNGKLPAAAAAAAKKINPECRTILLSGAVTEIDRLSECFDAVFSIASGPCTLEKAISETRENLFNYGRSLGRLLSGKISSSKN